MKQMSEWKVNREGVLIRMLDICVGAYSDGKLVGFGGCIKKKRWVELAGVYVLSEYRKQGIGTKLTSYILKEIAENNPLPVKVVSNAKLNYARLLNTQYGFTLTGTTDSKSRRATRILQEDSKWM